MNATSPSTSDGCSLKAGIGVLGKTDRDDAREVFVGHGPAKLPSPEICARHGVAVGPWHKAH